MEICTYSARTLTSEAVIKEQTMLSRRRTRAQMEQQLHREGNGHWPPHHLREGGLVIAEVVPSEVGHAIMSNLPQFLINTTANLFAHYLPKCEVPTDQRDCAVV
ncbi:hypothetical protein RB195_015537 [Necator americanus]|uniref:START domain-containing protein n=1 Tax=Necator americanus TaxID=51031 RepID=A0ABR1E509_NECAM